MNESMRNHTSLGIGGRALYFVDVSTEEQICDVLNFTREEKTDMYVLGGGTNLLVSDKGVDGVVVHLDGGVFREMTFDGVNITAGAACPLSSLVKRAAKEGVAGFEPLAGIPGSVGGAVWGNAGTVHGDISGLLESVRVLEPDGTLRTRSKDELGFSYRSSSFENGDIIVQACFRGSEGDPETIEYRTFELMNMKTGSQPVGQRSCGCVFKNPQGDSAGRMIDQCGLKGEKVGQIEVSDVHANFFINRGKGNSQDMVSLMKRVADRVRDTFSVTLEPEIQMWGDCGWEVSRAQ